MKSVAFEGAVGLLFIVGSLILFVLRKEILRGYEVRQSQPLSLRSFHLSFFGVVALLLGAGLALILSSHRLNVGALKATEFTIVAEDVLGKAFAKYEQSLTLATYRVSSFDDIARRTFSIIEQTRSQDIPKIPRVRVDRGKVVCLVGLSWFTKKEMHDTVGYSLPGSTAQLIVPSLWTDARFKGADQNELARIFTHKMQFHAKALPIGSRCFDPNKSWGKSHGKEPQWTPSPQLIRLGTEEQTRSYYFGIVRRTDNELRIASSIGASDDWTAADFKRLSDATHVIHITAAGVDPDSGAYEPIGLISITQTGIKDELFPAARLTASLVDLDSESVLAREEFFAKPPKSLPSDRESGSSVTSRANRWHEASVKLSEWLEHVVAG